MNIVQCLGTLVKIFPVRYNFDLVRIYDRLTGVDGYTTEEWMELERQRSRREFFRRRIQLAKAAAEQRAAFNRIR